MAETQSDIRQEIEMTRAAMAEKIDLLEKRVTDIVDEAKRSVDPKHQTQQHPWLMMTLAVLAGYSLNNILFKSSSNGRRKHKNTDQFSNDGSSRLSLGRRRGGMIQTLAAPIALSVLRNLGRGVVRKAEARLEKKRLQSRAAAP